MQDSQAARRVLVVDDQPDHRAIYRAVLEHRGYEVMEAADGDAAVRLAEEARPHLVLIDVGLPWMDGWEVTRRLRSVPRTAAIPVVAISAHVGPEGAQLAEEAGCARFLSKNRDPGEVADAVAALIGA